MQQLFTDLDLDHDGIITEAELQALDANKDGKLQRKEMTGHFTFPFRPELPYGHPGYGMPLPKEPRQRARRLDGIFGWMDKNRDGAWPRQACVGNFGHGSATPLPIAGTPPRP